jgi:hypothetical protein
MLSIKKKKKKQLLFNTYFHPRMYPYTYEKYLSYDKNSLNGIKI